MLQIIQYLHVFILKKYTKSKNLLLLNFLIYLQIILIPQISTKFIIHNFLAFILLNKMFPFHLHIAKGFQLYNLALNCMALYENMPSKLYIGNLFFICFYIPLIKEGSLLYLIKFIRHFIKKNFQKMTLRNYNISTYQVHL